MSQFDYQLVDKLCKSVLVNFEDLIDTAEIDEWLFKNKSLYDKVNVQPKGLPAIANCNFNGVRYDHISKFHSLYYKIDFENNILSYKSHEESIVYFFEKMNTLMLANHLNGDRYLGMDLPDFFYSLGNAFQELQNRGNKQLYTEIVDCNICNQKQYYFKGYKDDSYLHLILKLENNIVKDIIECREAKCVIPNDIDTVKQVFIDTISPPF